MGPGDWAQKLLRTLLNLVDKKLGPVPIYVMHKITLCILIVSCCLQAQSEGNSLKDRLRKEIFEKQKMMREGRVIRSNVRVTVRLHNDSRLRGVVKGGRVIERVDGLQFVPAAIASPGAGLRLWYYNNTNSYIFLPFSMIKYHNIGMQLSDQEVERIETRIVAAKRLTDERRAMLARAKQEKSQESKVAETEPVTTAKPGGAASKTTGDELVKPSMDPALAKLLADFPPEDGWSEAKYQEIQQKKIVVGVYPDQKSAKFVEKFEEWARAAELAKVLEQQPAPRSLQDTGTKNKD